MNVNFAGIHNPRAFRIPDHEYNGLYRRIDFEVDGMHFEKLKAAFNKTKEDYSDLNDVHHINLISYTAPEETVFQLNEKPLLITNQNMALFTVITKFLNEISNCMKSKQHDIESIINNNILTKYVHDTFYCDDYEKELTFKFLTTQPEYVKEVTDDTIDKINVEMKEYFAWKISFSISKSR